MVANPVLIRPTMPWVVLPSIEEIMGDMPKRTRDAVGKNLLKPFKNRVRDIVDFMSGSLAFDLSKAIIDLPFGATSFGLTNTTLYFGLWAATLTDTVEGNTASECAYTSYARLALTNNTTIFAAGTGTTTYTKTFPSDATKSWATSTGTGTNNTVTYMAILNGNAATTADKGYAWCSITSTTINNGDTPQLAQNAVTLVMD